MYLWGEAYKWEMDRRKRKGVKGGERTRQDNEIHCKWNQEGNWREEGDQKVGKGTEQWKDRNKIY